MRCLSADKRGFTMVELAIAVTINTIFLTAFFSVFSIMNTHMNQQSIYFQSNRGARFALDRIARDVREAVSLVATHGSDTTADSVLILKLPSINSSGDPTNIDSQFDYVTYKLSGTDLVRSVDVLGGTSTREGGSDQTNRVVATGVSAITFSTASGMALGSVSSGTIPALHSVNVSITVQGSTLGRTQSTSVDADLYLRNQTA